MIATQFICLVAVLYSTCWKLLILTVQGCSYTELVKYLFVTAWNVEVCQNVYLVIVYDCGIELN